MDKVFKIEDLRPIRDEMTVSRNSRLSDKTPITYFSLGKGTSISQESYDNTTVYIGAKGCADFLIGAYAAKHTISEGDMLVVPSKILCGVTTETGCIYTEIIIKKENNNMNFNNFTIKSQEAVQQSVQLVSQRGQQVIEAAHILKAVIMTGESVVNFLFQKLGVNVQNLQMVLDRQLDSYPKVSGG